MCTILSKKARAQRIVAYLKEAYSTPKSELVYETPVQFVVAVMLSAQCTDKVVNRITEPLYKKYKTPNDFATADLDVFTREISSITFYKNKAKYIVAAAKRVVECYAGLVPRTQVELLTMPGIGYKTAHVVLGELFNIYEGIATDTHVRRFALRFDLTHHTDLTKISKDLEVIIPKEDWRYVNNGLVLYGRYVCKAQPHACEEHPLTKLWPDAVTCWPKAK